MCVCVCVCVCVCPSAHSFFEKSVAGTGYVPGQPGVLYSTKAAEVLNDAYWNKELDSRHLGATVGYIAPELIMKGKEGKKLFDTYRHHPASDIFAAGLILLALLTRKQKIIDHKKHKTKAQQYNAALQASSYDSQQIISLIKSRKKWAEQEIKMIENSYLIDLCIGCLWENPDSRITAETALSSYLQ